MSRMRYDGWALVVAALASGLAVPAGSVAQQFVVDDVGVAEHRACQLEAWHGATASWVLPACSPMRNLEVAAGVGSVEGDDRRDLEYVVEMKATLREPGGTWPGVGLVAGVGLDPHAQVTGRRVPGVFAYVPVTVAAAGDRVLLHANLGWYSERRSGATAHSATWGVRADYHAIARLAVIGEVFGEDAGPAEYQVGLRATLLPDLLHMDLSYGAGVGESRTGTGWVLGLAFTPPPFH